MRHILPTLACTLLLAACGSHSGNTGHGTAAPAATPAASGTSASTAAAAPASSTPAATPATTGTTAAPGTVASPPASNHADNASADSGNFSPAPLSKAQLAQAKATYEKGVGKWVQGKNYFLISPTQPKVGSTNKIELVEVFSWGCPACNAAHTMIDAMRKSLPSYATMAYLPAAFRPDENWVVYQRAFYTAKAMGVARKSYNAVFDATWKSGELATYNLAQGRPKPRSQWPGIQAFAKFFAKHYGVNEKEFLAISKSFTVNTKMKQADALIKAYGVPATPTLVVDGKYRFDFLHAGSYTKGAELARWLIAKEALGK